MACSNIGKRTDWFAQMGATENRDGWHVLQVRPGLKIIRDVRGQFYYQGTAKCWEFELLEDQSEEGVREAVKNPNYPGKLV